MIWFILLIPLAMVIFLSVKFTKKITVWEYLLVLAVPALTIFLGKVLSVSNQTKDHEYWNSYLTSATYYEEWDEWDTETCTREDCSGSGDDRTCTTESYDCSHRDYHGPTWSVNDNLGNSYGIDSKGFEDLCKIWGMRQFQDMHRDFYHIDGDAYLTRITDYSKIMDQTIPCCVVHNYENKVQASRSVFNFQDVDSQTVKQYGLYDYNFKQGFFAKPFWAFDPIFGISNPEASKKLQKYNALNGQTKQIHMMILVFKDKPYEAALMQENYWRGGNKNEFILCIGVNGKRIQWTKVISWTEVEDLKIRVARVVKEMDTLNIMTVVDYMGQEVPPKFVRKRFRDFNYLTIEPTSGAIFVTCLITLLVTVGLAVFSIKNDFTMEKKNEQGYKSYRW